MLRVSRFLAFIVKGKWLAGKLSLTYLLGLCKQTYSYPQCYRFYKVNKVCRLIFVYPTSSSQKGRYAKIFQHLLNTHKKADSPFNYTPQDY